MECASVRRVNGCGTVAIVNSSVLFLKTGGVEIRTGEVAAQGAQLRLLGGQDETSGVNGH